MTKRIKKSLDSRKLSTFLRLKHASLKQWHHVKYFNIDYEDVRCDDRFHLRIYVRTNFVDLNFASSQEYFSHFHSILLTRMISDFILLAKNMTPNCLHERDFIFIFIFTSLFFCLLRISIIGWFVFVDIYSMLSKTHTQNALICLCFQICNAEAAIVQFIICSWNTLKNFVFLVTIFTIHRPISYN